MLHFGLSKLAVIASVCLLEISATLAHAGTIGAVERVDTCSVYENSGKHYHVQAIITDGSDLNYATRSYGYDGNSKYIVIFWTEGQATVIKIGYLVWPPYDTQPAHGNDQEGRPWKIYEYGGLDQPCRYD
jgi:hypothetical protein